MVEGNLNLKHRLRDVVSIAFLLLFMFPIFWWALNSVKPASAIYDKDRVIWFDFAPTIVNYEVTLLSGDSAVFHSRDSIVDTLFVSIGATLLTVCVAVITSFALWYFPSRRKAIYMVPLLLAWVTPPIALLIPLLRLYQITGLFDTYLGVILAHTVLHLPFAILLLKSFFDDVPREVLEAATLDGATTPQVLIKVAAPMISGGLIATALLCFVFSWTEFMTGLFLTSQTRLLPVQLSVVQTQTWGFTSALGTAALVPAFLVIVLVRQHLVRGLTLGMYKSG